MKPSEMDRLIAQHLAAENSGDPEGSVAMYTEDIEHDVVGFPSGPNHGKEAAQHFYEYLTANLKTEEMVPTHTYYAENACTVEHSYSGIVRGEFMGIPGNGRRVTFRMLHVWEFRDGKISRENVWLDGAAIAAQLTAPQAAASVA